MDHEAAIRQNIALWAQQYNAHDASGLAAWYALESVYVAPTGVACVGPEQIFGYFQASFKRAPEVAIKVTITQVRMEKPDLAVGVGTFEITNAKTPGGQAIEMHGPWVSTFVMEGEQWVPLTHSSAITHEAYVPMET